MRTRRTYSGGSIQLCAGQDAGCEAAVHAMEQLFTADDTEAMILVDATNAFNRLNRLCSALKFRLFVVNALGKEKTSSHRINYMKYIIDLKEAKM